MTPGRLILRVDGGPGIGWGHVSRCLALAQAWIDSGGVATVASGLLPPEWRDLCDREGIDVREPQAVDYRTAEWVVVDGYHLSETDRHAVESAGCRTAVIDDDGRSSPIRADVIVDQNLGATAISYRGRGEGTEVLLGTRCTRCFDASSAKPAAGAARPPRWREDSSSQWAVRPHRPPWPRSIPS